MGESENENWTIGAIYIILGLWISVYFNLTAIGSIGIFGLWSFVPREAVYLVNVVFIIGAHDSLVLVIFELVLVVGGGVWLARVSVVLCVHVLLCYLFAMFYPLRLLSFV